MSDPERRSGSSYSMSDPERRSDEERMSDEDSIQRMFDPERMSEDDLVAKRPLSDSSVDKPSFSSSDEKSNGDDNEPNYVSKMKIVLITKKKKEEDTEKTTEEESSEDQSLRTVESLLNNINRMAASAIQKEKEEKEESEREKLVVAIQIYVNKNAPEDLGWKPQIIRVDGLLALHSMELLNIICYVVEEIFWDEISLQLEKPEYKGVPIVIFSLQKNDKKWRKVVWGEGGGEENMVNELCERDVFEDVLKKAMEVKDGEEEEEDINVAVAGNDDDEGSDHGDQQHNFINAGNDERRESDDRSNEED